jgi:hypothetical protein
VSANDFRSRQAFEAAESGLQMALAYIGSSGGADKDGIPGNDPVFDTNADGIGDSLTAAFPDSSSAWLWHVRWRINRVSCYSTSRLAPSMRRFATNCGGPFVRFNAPSVSRRFSLLTTRKKLSAWPTASA